MSPHEANPDPSRLPDPPGGGRLLLVGARRQVRRLATCLDQPSLARVPIVGYVDLSGRGRQFVVHPKSDPVPILGRLDRLAELVRRTGATDLVVALSGCPNARRVEQISGLSHPGVRVHWVDGRGPAPTAEALRRRPRWTLQRPPLSWRLARLAKRLVDIVGATVGLVMLSPLLLTVAAVIAITTGRPIFYTQQRVGQGGRTFRIVKFRSMRVDAERETGPIWAKDHDERCTKIGDWLRHSNIDELPQLINVLKGDMSLVGPRPERPMFVEQFRAEFPEYEYRHAAPVGMTGWAQVHGWRGRTSLRKRLQYDLDYIRRWSFWLDFVVLFMTVQHVVMGKTKWAPIRPRRSRLR
jgi:exopolysaccharide biosynthesis polyprenyl glycosylphosphotransferase